MRIMIYKVAAILDLLDVHLLGPLKRFMILYLFMYSQHNDNPFKGGV